MRFDFLISVGVGSTSGRGAFLLRINRMANPATATTTIITTANYSGMHGCLFHDMDMSSVCSMSSPLIDITISQEIPVSVRARSVSKLMHFFHVKFCNVPAMNLNVVVPQNHGERC